MIIIEPDLEILVFKAYTQTHPLNAHADISSGTRGLNCGLSLHLHPNLVFLSRESSGECGNL